MSERLAKPGRRQIDWEAIEREYRAGQLSVREIARQHGVGSAGTIVKRAKKYEWDQDFSGRVRQATAARLALETAHGNSDGNSVSSRETIRLAAARGVEVVRQHRATAARGQRVVAGLLAELEATAACLPEIEAEIDATMRGLAVISSKQAISVGNRAKAAQALAGAMATLTAVERVAFSLDAPGEEKPEHNRAAALAELRRLGALEEVSPPS